MLVLSEKALFSPISRQTTNEFPQRTPSGLQERGRAWLSSAFVGPSPHRSGKKQRRRLAFQPIARVSRRKVAPGSGRSSRGLSRSIANLGLDCSRIGPKKVARSVARCFRPCSRDRGSWQDVASGNDFPCARFLFRFRFRSCSWSLRRVPRALSTPNCRSVETARGSSCRRSALGQAFACGYGRGCASPGSCRGLRDPSRCSCRFPSRARARRSDPLPSRCAGTLDCRSESAPLRRGSRRLCPTSRGIRSPPSRGDPIARPVPERPGLDRTEGARHGRSGTCCAPANGARWRDSDS